jgi:GTP-binding protein
MKFIDELVIDVEGGKGGNGMIAFRREKFVPFGGPSGGDGGKGGSIILEASHDLNTLYDLSFQKKYKGEGGENGMAKDKFGAEGQDIAIKVPVGTLIYDSDSGELLADLEKEGSRFYAAVGGRGGKGNAKFVSSVNRAPRMAEKGEPGEQRRLRLELKLLADVGLVGLPNAGKSTLLSVLSNARPKIADYPFTTLVPNLGIVKSEGLPAFCMADLPGLIEGAHQGAGLGIQFLKHIERTRVLVHLIDLSCGSCAEAVSAYETVMNELDSFNPELCKRPMVIAANKLDLTHAREELPELIKVMKKRKIKVFPISGATQEGLPDLVKAVAEMLLKSSAPVMAKPASGIKTYRFMPPFEIEHTSKNEWTIRGREIERLLKMTDFATDEGVTLFKTRLHNMGFLEELSKHKGEDDDTVIIGDMEFAYWEFFR